MRKIYISLVILLACSSIAYGQKVQGSILDQSTGEGVKGARVQLFSLSDSTKYAAFSSESGEFTVYPDAAGEYELSISVADYAPVASRITVPEVGILLNPIGLTPSYEMEAVTIQEEKAIAQQKGDTTEYNATAFTTNPDATAADLVKKMPGITTQNGQTSANGEQVQQILVDGRPFFGTDPQAALNNLPAQVVDKIQVFDQQSEQSQFTGFDDGQTTKTINIVTKPETRNGTFGTGYAGYGYEDRYKAGGNINFFNDDQRISIVGLTNNINQQNFAAEDLLGVASSGGGRRGGGGGQFGGGRGGGGSNVGDFLVDEQGGISTTHAFGVNYSDEIGEKFKISGSYFFNLADQVVNENILQQYLTGSDTGQVYSQDLISDSRDINHRVNLRMEYEISENTSLMWRPRVTIQQNSGTSTTTGITTFSDAVLNNSVINYSSDYSAMDLNSMLMLRHRFEKPMRTLSLRLNTGYSNSTGSNNQYSELNYFAASAISDTIDQSAFLDVNGYDNSINLMYTEPVFGKAMLSSWYTFAPNVDDSEMETFTLDPISQEYSIMDTQLTNVFKSTYRTQEVGTGLMYRFSKGMVMARVGFQEAKLNNEQQFPQVDTIGYTFYNVLPMLMYRTGRGRDNSAFVMYRSSTSSPGVTQLQDVIDNSNPLQLSSGNPALEQSVSHMLRARYSKTNTEKGRVISLNLNGTLTQGYIANSSIVASEDMILDNGLFLQRGAQFTQPVNLDGYQNASAFVTYGQSIKPLKVNLNLFASATYSKTPGIVNGILNTSQNTGAGLGVVLSSNISENVDFTLSSNTDLNVANNSAQPALDTRYWSQLSTASVNLIAPGGWVLRSSLNHQLYRGLTEDYNQDYFLLGGAVAKKVFPSQRGEFELSMFDILGQNTSISRTATEIYIQDRQTNVLQRYVMLTFRYQIRNFEGELPQAPDGGFRPGVRDGRPDGPPPGGRP